MKGPLKRVYLPIRVYCGKVLFKGGQEVVEYTSSARINKIVTHNGQISIKRMIVVGVYKIFFIRFYLSLPLVRYFVSLNTSPVRLY